MGIGAGITVKESVPVEKDCPTAVIFEDKRKVREPLEKDAPAAVICDGARMMKDSCPVDVDDAEAVREWAVKGGIVMAREPADVEAAEAVILCRVRRARVPVDVDAAAAVIVWPALTDSISRVPGANSKPEYDVEKMTPNRLRLKPAAPMDSVCWINQPPLPVADVSQ